MTVKAVESIIFVGAGGNSGFFVDRNFEFFTKTGNISSLQEEERELERSSSGKRPD